jgi:hypothetical protein
VTVSISGMAVIQPRTSSPFISTSQALQDPIRHLVGILIFARVATVSNDSPGVAVIVILSGKKVMMLEFMGRS